MPAGWLMAWALDKMDKYKLNHAYIDRKKRYCVCYRKDGTFLISPAQTKKQAKNLFAIFDKDAVEIIKIIQRREEAKV